MGLGYGLLVEPQRAIKATLLRVCAPRLSKACPSKKNRMTLYTPPPRQPFQGDPRRLNLIYYTAGIFANPTDQYGHHHQSPALPQAVSDQSHQAEDKDREAGSDGKDTPKTLKQPKPDPLHPKPQTLVFARQAESPGYRSWSSAGKQQKICFEACSNLCFIRNPNTGKPDIQNRYNRTSKPSRL